jgi:hypothetical protein
MAKKLRIAEVKAVVPAPDGSAVVVRVEALAADERTEVEIAVTTDLAARTAIALLATTAKARASRDGLEPALEVLAAAVVASGCADKVRLQLLFDEGAVLPLEVPTDAAKALSRDLSDDLDRKTV